MILYLLIFLMTYLSGVKVRNNHIIIFLFLLSVFLQLICSY